MFWRSPPILPPGCLIWPRASVAALLRGWWRLVAFSFPLWQTTCWSKDQGPTCWFPPWHDPTRLSPVRASFSYRFLQNMKELRNFQKKIVCNIFSYHINFLNSPRVLIYRGLRTNIVASTSKKYGKDIKWLESIFAGKGHPACPCGGCCARTLHC